MITQAQPTIAITGANGFLGKHLVEYFARKQWAVVAFVRNVPQLQATNQFPNVTFVEYDLSMPVAANTLQGVDYLVHAAFIKLSPGQPDAYAHNLNGAKALLAVSRATKVRKNIFISSMSAHDEATSVYGRQKLAIEKVFNSSRDINLKCGLIIGPGGIVREMSDFMKSKHLVPLVGGGSQPLQIIGINDLVRVIDNALSVRGSATLVAATPTVYSYKDFYRRLAVHLDVKVLMVPIPYWSLRLLFRLCDMIGVKLGIGEDNLKGLRHLKSMPSEADLKKLDIKLQNLDEALAAL